MTKDNMTLDQAFKQAKSLATQELNSPCWKFAHREGTRYHSERCDWDLFYRNDTLVQVIHVYVEPNGYSVQVGMQYERDDAISAKY